MTANNVTKPTQLPHPRRFITTHDEDGKAVFSHQLHETVPFWPVGPKEEPAAFGLAYTTSTAPVRLAENDDLVAFANADKHRQTSGLVQDGGTVLRPDGRNGLLA
ncbi:hypothetical protein FSPOR_5625 [Fusarium sporotrichioides]|uniref:Uncharacterized protein n=1 Tax=Fusarium sporotrichioides TaxID=5514 RepID=A0A395S6D0_FUSSP|nr:hypothetical protein FSPOR_5625 [Fusarium sporotrichioides]